MLNRWQQRDVAAVSLADRVHEGACRGRAAAVRSNKPHRVSGSGRADGHAMRAGCPAAACLRSQACCSSRGGASALQLGGTRLRGRGRSGGARPGAAPVAPAVAPAGSPPAWSCQSPPPAGRASAPSRAAKAHGCQTALQAQPVPASQAPGLHTPVVITSTSCRQSRRQGRWAHRCALQSSGKGPEHAVVAERGQTLEQRRPPCCP